MGMLDDPLLGPSLKTAGFLGYISAQNNAADARSAAYQAQGQTDDAIGYIAQLVQTIRQNNATHRETALDLEAAEKRIVNLLRIRDELVVERETNGFQRNDAIKVGNELRAIVESLKAELAQSNHDLQAKISENGLLHTEYSKEFDKNVVLEEKYRKNNAKVMELHYKCIVLSTYVQVYKKNHNAMTDAISVIAEKYQDNNELGEFAKTWNFDDYISKTRVEVDEILQQPAILAAEQRAKDAAEFLSANKK